MVMNLGILILASLPEAFLNLTIMLILAGQKDRLSIKKSNIIRFAAALVLMVAASWIIRPMASTMIVSLGAHSFAYSIILIVLYRIDIRKAFYCVTAFCFFFTTVENTYYPFLIAYVYKGLNNYQSSSINFLLCAIPIRIFQIWLTSFLWKYIDALALTKLNKKFYYIFSLSFFVLTLAQCFLSFYYVMYFDEMKVIYQIIFSIALFLIMVVFITVIYSFLYISVKGIIKQGYMQYQHLEASTQSAFIEVYRLLKNNDVKGATLLIEEFTHIKEEEKRR